MYPPFLRKLMAEAVLIWAVLRFLLTAMADEPLVAMVSILLLAACALLVRLELRLMRERMFFMNLGVPPALLVGLALLPAALLELAVRWISRA